MKIDKESFLLWFNFFRQLQFFPSIFAIGLSKSIIQNDILLFHSSFPGNLPQNFSVTISLSQYFAFFPIFSLDWWPCVRLLVSCLFSYYPRPFCGVAPIRIILPHTAILHMQLDILRELDTNGFECTDSDTQEGNPPLVPPSPRPPSPPPLSDK